MLYINLNKPKPILAHDPSNPGNMYTWMQKSQYYHLSSLCGQRKYDNEGQIIYDTVEGNFAKNCLWPGYEILFKGLLDLDEKDVLDFGCGMGKNILCFHNRVNKIDGVDLCQTSLNYAKNNIEEKGITNSELLLCNGIGLSEIPDNTYDLIISTRCLQHISVYNIRFGYFREFFRVLKPGGEISIQMTFGLTRMTQVPYYRNYWNATGTNGRWDVKISTPQQLENDLTYLGAGFVDFKYEVVMSLPDAIQDRYWIFFKAKKPINKIVPIVPEQIMVSV